MSDTPEKAKRDFRQEATDLIVSLLEQGTSPWQRPWDKNAAATALAMPHNGVTGRAYTGGNAVYLMAKGMQQGYDDSRWMTYEQAHSMGWQVRKGEKATHVEFWQFDKTEKVKDPTTGKESEQRVKLERPIQRLYAVFNARQIDGVPALAVPQRDSWQVIEAAERALGNSGAQIVHGGSEAFYQPARDQITLPPKTAFADQASYYGTALHELAHWTGHASRLNREGITGGHRFGSEGYAREELRAEMASVFLQAELGVPHDIDRHASYVDHWIGVLRQDKNELFRAAKDASRAADYVVALSQQRERDNARPDAQATPGEPRPPVAKEQLVGSLQQIGAQARKLLGERATTFPAQDEGRYLGPIIAHSEHHVLQQVSATTTVAHLKSAFAEVPAVNRQQPVKVPYQDGRATAVAHSVDRERTKGRGLGR